MTFTYSDPTETDYAKLGMCPVCGIRFTRGCEHSDVSMEYQQWLAAYIVAEQLGADGVDELLADAPHPVEEAQKIEREIDAKLAHACDCGLDNPDGTEPSPIISGGEIFDRTYPTGHDDIPF